MYVVVITSTKDYSTEVIGPFGDKSVAEDYLENSITLAPHADALVVQLENPSD